MANASSSVAPTSWSPSLFDSGLPTPDCTFARLRRRHLEPDAWVDHAPGWLSGSAALFDALVGQLGWSGRTVPMYGELVDQPRLTAVWRGPDCHPLAGPVIEEMRRLLAQRYGARFSSVGANLYRDGRDSVAWHGDRVARDLPVAIVAIVSLGQPRPFRLRPKGGGASIGYALGGGDLLVMGGSCQRTWQHTVPKVAHAGPRLSLTFRHELRRSDQSGTPSPMGHDTPVPPSPQ